MKLAKIISKGVVRVRESQNDLRLSDGDILVKMKACGICGSDLEKVYSEYGMSSSRLGHEPSGQIISIGKNVKGFNIGDRVFVHHHVSCNSCHYCRHGNNTMCNYYQKSNIEPCGLADKFIVPAWNVSNGGVLKLPNKMSFAQAALIEPLACCIRSLNKIKFQSKDNFAIFGAGPAGIMFANLIRLYGAGKIFLLDLNQFRLDFSKKNNSDLNIINPKNQDYINIIKNNTEKIGVDISIIATSSTNAFSNSFNITRKGGQIILFGVPPKKSDFLLDLSLIYSNEFSIFPSYAASEIETNQALKLLAQKRLDLDFLITHKFKLDKSSDAIICAYEAKECMKVIITSR